MSPQPLSRVKPDAWPIILARTSWGLDDYHPLFALVARVIGTWSHCEHVMELVMAEFLQADFVVAQEMLDSMRSWEMRRRAILAAARRRVSGEAYDLLEQVMKASKSVYSRRNELAHHLWATSPALPEALILIPPRVLSRLSAERHELRSLGDKSGGTGTGALVRNWDPSEVFVYREADLRRDLGRTEETLMDFLHVWALLSGG